MVSETGFLQKEGGWITRNKSGLSEFSEDDILAEAERILAEETEGEKEINLDMV